MRFFRIHEILSNFIPIYPTSSRFFQLHYFQFHVELDTFGSDICSCDSGSHGNGEKYDGDCTKTNGSCACECNSGFKSDGLTFDDVNECVVQIHVIQMPNVLI